jgi:hypothetical protein
MKNLMKVSATSIALTLATTTSNAEEALESGKTTGSTILKV